MLSSSTTAVDRATPGAAACLLTIIIGLLP